MKRSKMIELMVEYADSEFVLTLEQLADRMLDACEEEGMLPPMTYAEAIPRGFVDNVEVIEEYCNWEPEDV